MIFRTATAQNLRNPDLFPIISPILNETPATTGINFALSATDAKDTITATLQSIVSSILTSSDTIDTLEANLNNIVSISASATDSKDTAEITTDSDVSYRISATDTKDVSNITATVDTTSTLETIDTQDKARFYLSGTEKKKAQGAYLDPLLYKLFLRRSIKLNTKENKDVAIFEAEHVKQVVFNITERTDRAIAIFKTPAVSQFAIYENITDSMYSNKEEHDRIVLDRYNQYEQDQILAILSAA